MHGHLYTDLGCSSYRVELPPIRAEDDSSLQELIVWVLFSQELAQQGRQG